MNMIFFISYCRDVILSAGCSIDDCDSGYVNSPLSHSGHVEYTSPILVTKTRLNV